LKKAAIQNVLIVILKPGSKDVSQSSTSALLSFALCSSTIFHWRVNVITFLLSREDSVSHAEGCSSAVPC